MAEHGIEHDPPELEEVEEYDDAGGYRAMRRILHRGGEVTAVVCSGDSMAAARSARCTRPDCGCRRTSP